MTELVSIGHCYPTLGFNVNDVTIGSGYDGIGHYVDIIGNIYTMIQSGSAMTQSGTVCHSRRL